MCISGSVGRKGSNTREDVVVIQVLLNYGLPVPYRATEVDGACGKGTIAAIETYQTEILAKRMPLAKFTPGLIAAGDETLKQLQAALPAFDLTMPFLILKGIMPRASEKRIDRYRPYLQSGMADAKINTALRAAHFLAQLAHESGNFLYAEEIASGAAYEGRADLGNTQAGDGVRFKGRGLIQLTGRTNYKDFGESVGTDFLTEPNNKQIALDAKLAVGASCWFWSSRNLNEKADKDDVKGITKVINGGYTHLAERKAYLKRAKFFFGL